jgi:hypothetical protein
MKTTVVIVSRNDNYGGNLIERSTFCLNSAIDTYDEVIYVDWNSPDNHSLLWDIKSNLKTKGNLKHLVITPEIASILTNHDPDAQVCCEVLARNLGIRRATGDYIISTNIDIIHPRRKDLIEFINNSDKDTFYTISRRDAELPEIIEFQGTGQCEYNKWEDLREHLISQSQERKRETNTVNGDEFSLINCCGDFQIASKHIWNEIRGFEEDLIYTLYADSNVQKKAKMHGFNIEAAFSPALFHINHGRGGGGLGVSNRKTNDSYRAIINQEKTLNTESWGFGNTDIEFEIF